MKLLKLSERKKMGIPKDRINELGTKHNKNIRGTVKIFDKYEKNTSSEATYVQYSLLPGAKTIYDKGAFNILH